jgi:hypothetical protein
LLPYCVFNCAAAAVSVVPAANVEVTATPDATPGLVTLNVPEIVSVVAATLNVAVLPVVVVEAVGVGFVIAVLTVTPGFGAEMPTPAADSAPTVSEKLVAPELVPSETKTVFAAAENTEVPLKFVVDPMFPISVKIF